MTAKVQGQLHLGDDCFNNAGLHHYFAGWVGDDQLGVGFFLKWCDPTNRSEFKGFLKLGGF